MTMTRKKMNFQTHNDLQASHVIAIFAAFKKLSQKRSNQVKDFVFITLLKNSGGRRGGGGGGRAWAPLAPPPPSAQLQHCE